MNVLGMTFAEFCQAAAARPMQMAELRALYQQAMRGEEVAQWPVLKNAEVGANKSVLPLALAGSAEPVGFHAGLLPVVRQHVEGDLTKFVQKTHGGYETESVIVPMGGRKGSWKTLCISSQVGCAMGCTFCETAQLGLVSQLSPAEIVGQAVAARRDFGAEVRNIVFMGMGEPLDNYDHVIQAVKVISDPNGMSLAKGHITISTVGRVDGIRRLAGLGWKRLNLAVSLNAPNDEIRSKIMPINRKDNMAALHAAMSEYPLRNGGHIMIAYVLIPGVNDQREHARELAAYTKSLRCCVNVIPYNPRRDSPWEAPSEEAITWFLSWLVDEGQYCKRRITKGREHMAACGQLGNREIGRRATAQAAIRH